MDAIFDTGPADPCPADFNMAAHVLQCAALTPDKIALSVLSREHCENWRYDQLAQAIRGTATGLLRRGLVAGDIVLLRLGNTVEFPICFLAAIAVGLIPVPLSAQLTEAELVPILSLLKPRAVLRDPDLTFPSNAKVMQIDVHELRHMQSLPQATYLYGAPDRLAYFIFTSGTSGRPRAVMHAHRVIWARERMHQGWTGLRSEDRLLHAGAFNWSFTLGTGLMDPWRQGATALIPAAGLALSELPSLLKHHEVSIFAAVPGVYRKILQHQPKLDLPKLRHGVAAGETLSDRLRHQWYAATAGGLIHEAFGMSECSTFLSANPDAPADPGYLGRPQPGRRVAILGPEGPVSFGEEGEIAIDRHDPGVMLGYFGAPEDSQARMRGPWFLTGDRASMAPDGQIKFAGRSDDMMNAGGYRVSPLEVEAVMHGFEGIEQIGVTDIEVKPETRIIVGFYCAATRLDEAQLNAYAAQHLARYKQPRAWVHLASLPSNPNGKLARKALARHFKTSAE